MHSFRVVCILIQFVLFWCVCFSQNTNCQKYNTCSECIKHVNCSWCKDINFSGGTRCGMKDINDKCPSERVEPHTEETFRGKEQDKFEPDVIHANFRVGETLTFNFNYTLKILKFPVDLYYVMDLSATMVTHRDKLSKLASELTISMKLLTEDFKLGFGSFVDKTVQPFVSSVPEKLANPCGSRNPSCVPAYSFRNHLSLTEDDGLFSKKVREASLSGNIDTPEGGLDAIMQAIVCKDIGWRNHARKLLIYSSDDTYHIAGDGKLAGIVKPNDGLCHLNDGNYAYSLHQDYPSIGQINAAVIKHDIILIFAVVQSQEKIYSKLKDNIRGAQIGILSNDSANIVELVKNLYTNIATKVKLHHNFPPNEFKVNLYSACTSNNSIERNECVHITNDTKIPFQIKITLQKCPEHGVYQKEYLIKVEGLQDNLKIVANMLCKCDCELPTNPDFESRSKHCSEGGDLQCGICNCDSNRSGANCECDGSRQETDSLDTCRPNQTAPVCSRLGECKCGVCVCNKRSIPTERITGKYCECDNYSCKRIQNKLCSGSSQGKCVCGKCECLSGWTGEACDCSTNINGCIHSESEEVCMGRGKCKCGTCDCIKNQTHRYTGQFCENCLSCHEQKCEEFRNCIECRIHETGNYTKELCLTNCHNYKIHVESEANSDEWVCSYVDENGCTFKFNFAYDDSDKLSLSAYKHKECPKKINTAGLATGIFAAILIPIIIGLITWKVCVTYHDKREYEKFVQDQKLIKWQDNESPFYINPIGKFTNPTYGK